MTKPKQFEARTWKGQRGETSLVLEETTADSDTANVWVARDGDGPSALLAPAQMRQLASELVRRADLIDPPERNWTDVPRTPSAIISDFLGSGKAATEHVWGEGDETPAEMSMRIAHIVSAFTVVALLAELAVVSPARAAAISELLADAWDDGGTVHELIWEWHEAHAAGKPVGFEPEQVLELEGVTRDA
jgi:hypothetical protein